MDLTEFMRHVRRTRRCWLWTAYRARTGYGQVGRNKLAHRHAWELFFGPIPDGMEVLHMCDNPPCVNPNHLRLGTHDENMADMAAKGRAGHHPKKVTDAQVAQIRASAATQSVLAAEFGVSQSLISRIRTGAKRARVTAGVTP